MVDGQTRVYGIIGDPVAHSISPLMHNKAFAACGLNCCYVPFRVAADSLPAAIAAVRALNMGGVNVTIPHKEQAVVCLDEIDQDAAMIGAVNTIVNLSGRLIGHNTDGAGFLASLRADAGFDPPGKRAVILGAGGAARAVTFALAQAGVDRLDVFDKSGSRAEALARDLSRVAGCRLNAGGLEAKILAAALEEADLLVNASPVGMYPNHEAEPPVNPQLLPARLLVYDLVYNPSRTRLLRDAGERGCKVLSGTGMLVHQGALAFELWTGRRAPIEVMRRAADDALR